MRALILFGHGSRDPRWREPIEAVAERIRASEPALHVACAYLELDVPDLGTSVDALAAGGAQSVLIVPMFLGVGKHAREDLPRLLAAARSRHPGVELRLAPALGEQSEVLDFLAGAAIRLS